MEFRVRLGLLQEMDFGQENGLRPVAPKALGFARSYNVALKCSHCCFCCAINAMNRG
jgi:hypothetical protein